MNQLIKLIHRLKGFRTLSVNLILAIMPVLEMSEVFDILPDNFEAPYAIIIALVNVYLRTITSTPVGTS